MRLYHNKFICDLSQLDAPAPTWEQLDKGLVAVKTVVHGLVDFIQNHSKKAGDPQQVCKSLHMVQTFLAAFEFFYLFLRNKV